MSTLQIAAIAVAVGLVVLLVIVRLLKRRPKASSTPEPAPLAHAPSPHAPSSQAPSFIDERLDDSFAGLGKAEQSVEDVTLDPVADDLADVPAAAGSAWLQGDTEVTGEMPLREAFPLAASTPGATAERVPESGSGATAERVPESGAGGTVPLSDIIVTTSNRLVDLSDPDVRSTLTDLVRLEVDQAIELRRQGQTVDAVMHLTEAEKVSHALGLHESAQRIREMIEELNHPA